MKLKTKKKKNQLNFQGEALDILKILSYFPYIRVKI